MIKKIWNKFSQSDETGQALILVLILLIVGALIIAPLMANIGTGLIAGEVHEKKANELYAADAGMEDALWQIKSDNIKTFKSPTFPTDYSPYDFSANWSYNLSELVNAKLVNVTINNVWIPSNITTPRPTDIPNPSDIIAANKLVVTGTTNQTGVISQYQIKVTYYPGAGENLIVDSLGIWLPPGFTYFSDSTHKSTFESLSAPYKSTPVTSVSNGNQAVVWSFGSAPVFQNFPNPPVSGTSPKTMQATFYFKPPQGQPSQKPDAVAWIKTRGVSDIPYAWDANIKIYKMTSFAHNSGETQGTTVESYVAKNELRILEAAKNGDYIATGKTLMIGVDPRSNQRELLLPDSTNSISSVSTNATVDLAYLYWAGWLKQPLTSSNVSVGVFWDNGNSLNKWTAGSSWTSSGTSATDFNGRFVGHYSSGGTNARYLTMKSNVDLTGVSSATIRWEQATSTLNETQVWQDTCSSANLTAYWQNGGDWQYSGGRYRGQDTTASVPTSPLRKLTRNPLDLSIYGSKGNIRVSWSLSEDGNLNSNDGLDFAYSLDGGTNWTNNQVFRGNNPPGNQSYPIAGVSLPSNFMIRFTVIGCTSSSKYINIDDITIYVTNDALYFDLSNDGGNTWPIRTLAFTGSNPTTPFSFAIPSGYWNAQFKMRFYIDGFDGANENVYLDNIGIMVTSPAITAKPADTSVTFTINNGTPHTITADPDDPAQSQSQVKDPQLNPHDGYYYGCRVDVTNLVKNESNGANLSADPKVYGNGNGDYKVADVYADSLKADGTTYGSASFAGWSLVIIYSSPDTKGHQLFLYDLKDTFQSVPADIPDSPPMQITGFIVPTQITGETEVAKLTFFVGEGDIQIPGDYIALVDQHDATEHLLWDGVNLPADGNTQGSPRNVWNGRSTGSTSSEAGVDIDTFHILWADNQLREGDTSAQINLHTEGDGYVTIYKILSFRSKTTTGGTVTYLIRQ